LVGNANHHGYSYEALNTNPNEFRPALISGPTMQPCGQLRCSAAGFKFFALCDRVSALNLKNKTAPAVPDGFANA